MTIERFVTLALCDHCEDPTSIAGETHTEPSPEHDRECQWSTYLAPRYVNPPPTMVRRSRGLPVSLEDALYRAEGLFWSDLGSAGLAIQNTIELIMTDHVIRGASVATVASTRFSLDARSLSMADVLDGFELLENLIEKVYGSEA